MKRTPFLPPLPRYADTPIHIAEGSTSRQLARAFFLLLCLIAIAGCRSPRRAELVVCVEQEPTTLDPRQGSDLASERACALLHRGLFRNGPDLRPVPDLAESWERSTPLRYRFALRSGVRFSDGREVTAADAAYTLESIRSGAVATHRRTDLEMVSAVRATGRHTLEVVLSRPFAPFLSGLCVGVVPEGTPQGGAPAGCGPYRLDRWVRGQWLLFSQNPHAAAAPRCQSLAFKVVPDAVVRALEVRRGSVDLVVNDLPPDALAHFAQAGYDIVRAPGANYRYIGFNCARPPLDRPEVRRALAMAVDRRALLRHLQGGFGRPADGLLCPENWARADGLPGIPYDPAGAEAILARAGYGVGHPLRLTYKTSADKGGRRIAVAVQDYLGRVGVKVEILSMEWGTFYADVQRGDFDLFGLIWVGITDPDALRSRYSSTAFPPAGLNRGRYANGELDRLLEAASQDPEEEARRALYLRAQQILDEEVPYIPLWYPDNVAVGRRGLEGLVLPPDGTFGFLSGAGWRGGVRAGR